MKTTTKTFLTQNVQPHVRKFCILVLATFSLIAAEYATAATYYMAPNGSDNNSGSLSSPWKTMSYASARLRAGDTLLARGGSYYGQGGYGWKSPSGTASLPITFKAYPGEKPVFDGQYTNGEFLIFTSSIGYIVVDGLTITRYNNKYGNGAVLLVNKAHHITLQNNTFVDNGANQNDHHIYLGASTPSYITIRSGIL